MRTSSMQNVNYFSTVNYFMNSFPLLKEFMLILRKQCRYIYFLCFVQIFQNIVK